MCVSTSICHHESLGKEQGPCSTGSDTRPSTARATRIILKDFLEFLCHEGGITFIFAAQTGWLGVEGSQWPARHEGRSGQFADSAPGSPPPHGL